MTKLIPKNYAKLLEALFETKPKVQFLTGGTKDWKPVVRNGLVKNQKYTISELKDHVRNAKKLLNLVNKEVDKKQLLSNAQKAEIQEGADIAARYLGSKSWRNKAIKYAGLTKEEAKKTQKYMVDNIYRYPVSSYSLREVPGSNFISSSKSPFNILAFNAQENAATRKLASTHEHLHASWALWDDRPERIIKDKDVLNGIKKLENYRKGLADELGQNLTWKGQLQDDLYEYWLNPDEVFARMSTGKAYRLKAKDVPDYLVDGFKPFVYSDTYKDIYKRMVATLPAIGGAALYSQTE